MKEKITVKIVILVIVAVLVGVVSFTVGGKHFSDPATYEKTIQTLDEKRTNVVALTGSAAAVSTGLAAIPGDATDPIANELADLSSTFMLIIAAILFEKYLLTLGGMFTFKFLIPCACILIILYLWTNRHTFAKVAVKLALFGICLMLLVPVSTSITNVIDETHQISVEQNMDEANEFAADMQKNANESENVIKKWVNKFSGGMKGILHKAEAVLENFIDAAAVLLITSCVIPLVTLWLLLWLMKTIIGIDTSGTENKLKLFAKSGSKVREKMLKKETTDLIE